MKSLDKNNLFDVYHKFERYKTNYLLRIESTIHKNKSANHVNSNLECNCQCLKLNDQTRQAILKEEKIYLCTRPYQIEHSDKKKTCNSTNRKGYLNNHIINNDKDLMIHLRTAGNRNLNSEFNKYFSMNSTSLSTYLSKAKRIIKNENDLSETNLEVLLIKENVKDQMSYSIRNELEINVQKMFKKDELVNNFNEFTHSNSVDRMARIYLMKIENLNNETKYQFDEEDKRNLLFKIIFFNRSILEDSSRILVKNLPKREFHYEAVNYLKKKFSFESNFVYKLRKFKDVDRIHHHKDHHRIDHLDNYKIPHSHLDHLQNKFSHTFYSSNLLGIKKLLISILLLLIASLPHLNANELANLKSKTNFKFNNSNLINSYESISLLSTVNLDAFTQPLFNYLNSTDNLAIESTTNYQNYQNYQNQINLETTSINETNNLTSNLASNSHLLNEKWWLNFFPTKYVDEKLELSEFLFRVFGVFVCSILICLTLFGNVLTITVVLRFNRMKTVTNILLAR